MNIKDVVTQDMLDKFFSYSITDPAIYIGTDLEVVTMNMMESEDSREARRDFFIKDQFSFKVVGEVLMVMWVDLVKEDDGWVKIRQRGFTINYSEFDSNPEVELLDTPTEAFLKDKKYLFFKKFLFLYMRNLCYNSDTLEIHEGLKPPIVHKPKLVLV